MSAEKEIVNLWLHKKGFFTLTDIRAPANKSIDILALKFEGEKLSDALHVEVSCSVSSSASDNSNIKTDAIVAERFLNPHVKKAAQEQLRQFPEARQILRGVFVTGGLPKSGREEILKKFSAKNISLIEFEDVLFDVLKGLDSSYYKDSTIRTLQLIKYLFLANPEKMSDSIDSLGVLNANTRKIFFNSVLGKKSMQKEFGRVNEEKIIDLFKHSHVKSPKKLAELLEKEILNKKTRKPFLKALLEQEKIRKVYKETIHSKGERPLSHFFK